MTVIEQTAYPRAGLLGNPSDGYFGKTISFTFRDFHARARLAKSARPRFAAEADAVGVEFDSRTAFMRRYEERCYGGEGGLRLLLAAARRFFRYMDENNLTASAEVESEDRNFTLTCATTIPRQVGLAGSSAIIMAALKAMTTYYGVAMPLPTLAQVCLEVETVELGLPAGLQDRVAQAYEGLVYMDFDRALMERQGHGRYERLDAALLRHVFIAWDDAAAEGTEVPHGRLRARWEAGEPDVRRALAEIAGLVDPGRAALEAGDMRRLGELMNRNFDLRAGIMPIHPAHRLMIETARGAGAAAKFAGSGGSIVGLVEDEAMFERVRGALEGIGARVIIPTTT